MILDLDKNQDKVKKVRFKTDIGEITWRAEISKDYNELDGFKVKSKEKVKPSLEELPEILYNIRDSLKNGPVTVATDYREWLYDGKPSYTFHSDNIRNMEIIGTYDKGGKKGKK